MIDINVVDSLYLTLKKGRDFQAHLLVFEFLFQIKTSIFLCQTIVMMNTIVGIWKNFPCLRWIVAPPIFQVAFLLFQKKFELDKV